MRITRKNICSAIKKETGFDVKLYKVKDDYFYFYSDDLKTDLMLSGLESTSILSNRLTHQSIEDWVKDFKQILKR
jgi:hypothetical protein